MKKKWSLFLCMLLVTVCFAACSNGETTMDQGRDTDGRQGEPSGVNEYREPSATDSGSQEPGKTMMDDAKNATEDVVDGAGNVAEDVVNGVKDTTKNVAEDIGNTTEQVMNP